MSLSLLYDVISLNNPKFNYYIDVIYLKDLEIKDTTTRSNH